MYWSNLAHVMNEVRKFISNAGKTHWETIKWIMRYLKGTVDIYLVYGTNGSTGKLVSYADSDYGGNRIKRRFLTCYIFTLYRCTINWKATLQPIVTLATTEAKHMSVTKGVNEGIWLHGLIDSLGLDV
jgi:hypothetical protein